MGCCCRARDQGWGDVDQPRDELALHVVEDAAELPRHERSDELGRAPRALNQEGMTRAPRRCSAPRSGCSPQRA